MKLCVITGTRAEYGLLRPLMKLVQEDSELELQLLVTGMHLAPEYGETWKTIEADGFQINSKVEMLLADDTATGVAKSTAMGLLGTVTELERLAPDWVIVLGDRYEIFAAVSACVFLRTPVAHFHGGETTEGAFDEYFRHAITKMSHLHFTATDDYRRRVIQLGEQPERVFALGAPGLDAIDELELLDLETFEEAISFRLSSKNALVTYHPETLDEGDPVVRFEEVLSAFDEFPDLGIIFTYPNADTGGKALIKRLEMYLNENSSRACGHISLGQLRYFSALHHVDVVIGNSSSGLIEAPVFGTPTVNIGGRQRGRSRGASVIDCQLDRNSVAGAIRRALSEEFHEEIKGSQSPYGKKGASREALEILQRTDRSGIVQKKFYDIE